MIKKLWLWFIKHKIYFDLIGFVGLGVMGYGLYLFKPFIAYTVVGLGLLVLAVFGAKSK